MKEFNRRKLSVRLLVAIFSASILLLFQANIVCAQETNETVRQSPYFDDREPKPKSEHKNARQSRDLSVPELEKHLFELINEDRAKEGAAALKLSPGLGKIARELAHDMIEHDYFGHATSSGLTAQQRAKRDGLVCRVYENIGTRSGPDPKVQMVDELEQSFVDEPKGPPNHRYVLLLPVHTHVGVGVARGKDSVVIVEDFADNDPEQKPDK